MGSEPTPLQWNETKNLNSFKAFQKPAKLGVKVHAMSKVN
jgi:hypothetical protein